MSVKGAAVKRLFFVFINEYSFSFLPQKKIIVYAIYPRRQSDFF